MTTDAVAVIDAGTNSMRMLAVDADGGVLTRRATVTRLGEGVNASGVLLAAAIERTLTCLRAYNHELDELGITRVRMIATSAVRDASNRRQFMEAAEEILGVPPEVLSGAEEGALSFAGATAELHPRLDEWHEPSLDMVVDIGGGSTEFSVGVPGAAPLGVWSLDVGCVRLTELYLASNPPTPVELSGAITVVHAHLDDLQRELPLVNNATRLIGVGGSITTVAAIELGRYNRNEIHAMSLSRAAAEDVFRTVATERAVDRAFNPGLQAERVATIVAGAAILVTVLRHLGLDGLMVSESDILDGVVAAMRSTQ